MMFPLRSWSNPRTSHERVRRDKQVTAGSSESVPRAPNVLWTDPYESVYKPGLCGQNPCTEGCRSGGRCRVSWHWGNLASCRQSTCSCQQKVLIPLGRPPVPTLAGMSLPRGSAKRQQPRVAADTPGVVQDSVNREK